MSPRNAGIGDSARLLSSRVAYAAWIALALYCALSFVVGPAGLISYRRLGALRAEMERNLGELGDENERLRVELESLRLDADRAAREARSLGYLRPDESAIVVAGRSSPRPAIDSGSVLAFEPPASCPDSAIKEISFGAFLAALAVGLAPQRKRRDQRASRT